MKARLLAVNRNQIIPDDTIHKGEKGNNDDKKKMRLVAFIVHLPGHYVSFMMCGSAWYYYNNTQAKDQLVYVGKYEDFLEYRDRLVTTHGVMHFYIKDSKEYMKE